MQPAHANVEKRAIITGKDSKYNSVDDIKGTTFGISRQGSGSQVCTACGVVYGSPGQGPPRTC